MTNSIHIGPAEGQVFYDLSMQQFDRIVIGEEVAKRAMLTAMTTGANGVVFGPPGGAKSTLIKNTYRLIDGINPDEEISTIPPHADLTAKELVGGSSEVERITNGKSEIIRTTLNARITPQTRIIVADEINRIAPFAVNAILPVLEEREMDTTAGKIELPDMEYAVASMNAHETAQGTFPIPRAGASRFRTGAVMGRDKQNEEAVVNMILGGWKPQPESMCPTTDIPTLHALRARALSVGAIAFPDSLRKDTAAKLMQMSVVLDSAGFEESPGRIARQIRENAQTLAMFDGEKSISEKHVNESIQFIVSARLGMLSTRAYMTAEEAYDQIVANR